MTKEEQDFFLENLGKSFEEFKKEAGSEESGRSSTAASSGNSSRAASSGDYSKAASSGNSSTAASSGNSSTAASSGYYSTAASSGYYSKAACDGKYSSATANGFFASVKGEIKGSVIASIEFDSNEKPIGCAWGVIGKDVEAGKEYVAHDGTLKELIVIDGIRSVLLSKRGQVKKVSTIKEEFYVVSDNEGNNAHGKTIKEARENLAFKVSDRDKSEFKSLTPESILTFKETLTAYRAITGACTSGMQHFIESEGLKKKKYKVSEVIEITKGAFGGKAFEEFINSNQRDKTN
jgi:hypothetical protein